MAYSLVQIQVHGNVGTVTLNRPEKRNALSRELLANLHEAFFDLHQERRVRTVILTGAGSAFCAGMDLAEMQATAQADDPMRQWGADAEIYHDVLTSMLRFPKPIVAAVNGPVVAGGAGLMLAADIVLAAPSAKFGLPEPRRGIVAGIVSPLLAFRVGAGRAARLLLEAAMIEAAEAYRIGLYHELVEPNQLWARAVQVAGECAQGAPEALLLTKRMLNETIGEHLFTLLSAGAAASATARTTEAAAEGVAAFLEKRPPQWK
jgi:enoyl-CoA hydratase/carnithine racemase